MAILPLLLFTKTLCPKMTSGIQTFVYKLMPFCIYPMLENGYFTGISKFV